MEKNKILVVEDEESLLRLESILLTSKGYDVVGARNGRQALEVILTDRPDLVLLDIMLPEIDGFEVCSRIKSNPETERIPVIMVTAKKPAKIWLGVKQPEPTGISPSHSSRPWL